MDLALLFFALVWGLLGRRGSGGATGSWQPPPEITVPVHPAGYTPASYTPAWPAVVPSSLPRFPGPGWEFDEPPPPSVQRRAGQLVAPLWARGKGASKIEQTAGRWIAYQAQIMASGRQGVVAYRLRPAPSPILPVSVTPQLTPASSPSPTTVLRMPTLRLGMGMPPSAPSPDVMAAQKRLGVVADGRFGPGTQSAVMALQRRRGLVADGVIGPLTWNALLNPVPATVRA
jgi:peptidoglycan hydrolase-like protein with peptidoglycan-binding domain